VPTPLRARALPAALVAAAVVVLAGCGSSNSSDNSSSSSSGSNSAALDAISVSGSVGKASDLTFKDKVNDSNQDSKVLVTGSGPTVNTKDSVVLQTVIADGTTKKTLSDSYSGSGPSMVDLSGQVQPFLVDALSGNKIGSRVLLAVPAKQIFGTSGNPQVGIGANDTLVFVLDMVGLGKSGPDGTSHSEPSWAPKVNRTQGAVSGLDFAKTPKPNGKLRVAALRSGTGPVLKDGQTAFVRYVGQVYRGKQPFDQNFTGQDTAPRSFQIANGHVITGWVKGLVGQRVGSEVVLQIPPQDAYGKKAQQGIPANSTLYFVVDILGAV
jgi:peptidylprolyl isomerase